MPSVRITLAGIWVAVMLVYLLGDVLRIFAGDFEKGKLDDVEATPVMWMVAATIMLIPILLLVLNLTLPHPAIRWVNIFSAAGLIVFNLFGLPYKGMYDNFLIVVSIIFKAIILWQAWQWMV